MTRNFNRSPWHIVVLIPARDEELLLTRCLHSIDRARAALPAHVTSDIVLVADNCTDGTLGLARRLLGARGFAIASHYGVVGHARALAAEIALDRYSGQLSRCWLANTDAVCELPSTWLTDQLFLAERGAEAIAGIVRVDTFDKHPAHVAARFRETYLLHADGTHPHVHGANLGVRGDAYRLVDGWHNLSTGEDHDLWNRLISQGCDCCSVSSLEVTTSGRVVGRAPDGFAAALAAHDTVPSNEAAA